MLTTDELARLTAATADPHDWGKALCVAFEARRLAAARVSWINRRWFLEQGVDVTTQAMRARTEAWLLRRFAYVVPRPEDSDAAFASDSVEFLADRYGATGLVPNGGSGRAGIRDGFQVKGIGVTPLVGVDADWLHSHGCVWLEEAIREAMFAELFAAESPAGAMPTIAILDTGLRMDHQGEAGERRALVVRPFVPRLAHLQRAPSFRPSNGDLDAQVADAARTRDAVRAYRGTADNSKAAIPTELFHRLGKQVAFSHLHRIGHGGFFSSNLTLRGELIDFGSATAWPDWGRHQSSPTLPAFGDEESNIAQIAQSLAFYLRKYGEDNAGNAADMLCAFRAGYAAGSVEETARIWGLGHDDSAAATISAVLLGAFARQQLDCSSIGHVRTPVALTDDECVAIDAALSSDPCLRRQAWRRGMRFLQPRLEMQRQRLQSWLFAHLHSDRSCPLPAGAVDAAMTTVLSATRRAWLDLPNDLDVHAQVSDGCSHALACRRDADGTPCVWLQGLKSGNRVLLFDRWYHTADLATYQLAEHPQRWTGIAPGTSSVDVESHVEAGRTIIRIPRMTPTALNWKLTPAS